jgi:hypothetical protein
MRRWRSTAAVLPILMLGCIFGSRPTLGKAWVSNHRCRPIEVTEAVELGQVGPTMVKRADRLAYGRSAIIGAWAPREGACSADYSLPPQFPGVVVRDDSGRTVLVDRSHFRQMKSLNWAVDIDDDVLRRSVEVDGGAYFSPSAVVMPGEKLPDANGGALPPCEGPADAP